MEYKANKIIEKLPSFSFNEFEKRLLNNSQSNEVFSAYDAAIARLSQEGRAGTADSYKSARNSLWTFAHEKALTPKKGLSKTEMAVLREARLKFKPLPFTSITPQFLKDYEKWMLNGGRSLTTVGFYLRTLCTLFNDALAAGDIGPELYPFGKRRFQIPAGVNVKKALTLADIGKIFAYSPTTESEARNRDLFLFSYLCSGINVKDIARLKYCQLDKDTLSFTRAKTERSTRHQSKAITVVLPQEALDIIRRWGNQPVTSEGYIFPILAPGLSPEQELAKVRQATKTINLYIKRIAAAVGIEKNVSTYTARHSFSTVLKRAGVSTAFISEALGHANEKTTQSYLDSFETDAKRQVVSTLTAFNK